MAAELRALFKSMRQIARAIDVQSRRIDRELGLTLPQLVVLGSVERLGEVTSRAISDEADLSPATVVGILDKLAAKGLIERYRSEVDRRIVHTRLTEDGRAALMRIPSPLGRDFETAFLALPPAERAATVSAFQRIARMVGAEEPPIPPFTGSVAALSDSRGAD